MDRAEFLDLVMSRLDIDDRDTAVDVVRAVLTTVGERIAPEDALNLAELLPEGIDQYLTESDHGQEFSVHQFLVYVVEREQQEIDITTARAHVEAVLEVVGRAVDPGDAAAARNPLPAAFQDLFAPMVRE